MPVEGLLRDRFAALSDCGDNRRADAHGHPGRCGLYVGRSVCGSPGEIGVQMRSAQIIEPDLEPGCTTLPWTFERSG